MRLCADCKHFGELESCQHEKARGISLVTGEEFSLSAILMRYGRQDEPSPDDAQPDCGKDGALWERK